MMIIAIQILYFASGFKVLFCILSHLINNDNYFTLPSSNLNLVDEYMANLGVSLGFWLLMNT
jgi:hypothetical protein